MPPAARTPRDPPPPRRHLAAVPDERAARLTHVVDRLHRRIDVCSVAPFDGMVWLAHLGADGKPRLFSRVSDPVGDLDELYLLDVLSTLQAIGLPGVVVAIWRTGGEPAAVDRRLARDLGDRLRAEGSTALDAVLVVGASGHRIVRPRRAGTRPAADPTVRAL